MDLGKHFHSNCARRLLLLGVFGLLVGNAQGQHTSPDLQQPLLSNESLFRPSWQLSGFATYGFVPFFESHTAGYHFSMQLDFANAGVEVGRIFSSEHGPGILRGRSEALVEVMPFWMADYPKQIVTVYYTGNIEAPTRVNLIPVRRYGASVTPVLFRWNFMKQNSRRVRPWAQAGGGLLWTNHKFPIVAFTTENTSVINFTPQVAIGQSFFIKKNRSLDFAAKAVHISNASLGDNNPGLNATLQFSAGYSWWR